jgi:recombination protein RecR
MNINRFPSVLLENAVNEFSRLPGVGRKTALRLVLFMLKQEKEQVEAFGSSIIRLKNEVQYCRQCHNISDSGVCAICDNSRRDHALVCVVENVKDVMAIENTMQFSGVYHVLGGIISPIDGIGPGDIELQSLFDRVNAGNVAEIILALPTTMEGDTTNYYIYKKLKESNVKITTLARGVSVGDELEYTDELTLARSIKNRTLFTDNIN